MRVRESGGPDPDRGPLADRWGVHRYRDGVATFLPFPEPEPGDTSGFHMSTSGAMPAPDGRLWFGTFEAAFGFDGSSWQILGRRATHRQGAQGAAERPPSPPRCEQRGGAE